MMNDVVTAEVVGPYRLERKLGAGGMGVVWLATDTLLDRPVAVKMMRGLEGDDADELRARFFREARAAARIKSRHVVQVLQLGMTPTGTVYIVMEVLDGVSLQDVLLRGAMSPLRAVTAARQIAEAMQAAHDIGVVHRDLKPANVMLVREGDVEIAKVLDFGIAKITTDTGPALTQAGVVLGTLPYMSPEQIDGGDVDARSDIYAFGMMLYRMLAGRGPWDINDVGVLVHHQRSVVPPPVRERAISAVAAALDDVVMRCLRKNPAERWQSMRELGTALGAAVTTLSASEPAPIERTSLSPTERTEDGSMVNPRDTAPAVSAMFKNAVAEVAASSKPMRAALTGPDDDDDDDAATLNEDRAETTGTLRSPRVSYDTTAETPGVVAAASEGTPPSTAPTMRIARPSPGPVVPASLPPTATWPKVAVAAGVAVVVVVAVRLFTGVDPPPIAPTPPPVTTIVAPPTPQETPPTPQETPTAPQETPTPEPTTTPTTTEPTTPKRPRKKTPTTTPAPPPTTPTFKRVRT